MVTITAGAGPVDFLQDYAYFLSLDGPASSITATRAQFDTGFTYFDVRLSGSGFADTDGDSRPDKGAVQTVEVLREGVLVFSVSGLAMPYDQFETGASTYSPFLPFLLTGDDEFQGSAKDDRFEGLDGDDVIHGHDGNDILTGGAGNDELSGGAGNDRLDPGEPFTGEPPVGFEQLAGGDGDDELQTGWLDEYVADGGAGVDSWWGNFSWVTTSFDISAEALASDAGLALPGNRTVRRVEHNGMALGSGDDIFRDRSIGGDDQIGLNAGSDTAYISAGRDLVVGKADSGNREGDFDQLFIDYSGASAGLQSYLSNTEDGPVFRLWEGATWFSNASRSVFAYRFDVVQIKGSNFVDRLAGTDGNDTLLAGAGGDFLTPQLGNDLLDGGDGSDTMTGYFSPFVPNFMFPEGLNPDLMTGVKIDLAITTAQALPKYQQLVIGVGIVERALGTVTLRAIENLSGTYLGDDLRGDALGNRLSGLDGDDLLSGRDGNDVLEGGAGNDTLLGGSGGDRIDGGAGSDTVSYASAIAAVKVNLATGAAQNTGGGGIDSLKSVENAVGSSKADSLTGTGGANRLDGGKGADTMIGGNGNDTYVVDNVADQAVETSPSGGTDRVLSSVSFTLGDYVENLTLTGAQAVRATGNALANGLTGNSAANTIDGGAGGDTMTGGNGNDTYVVDDEGDRVVETSARGGIDTVQSSITLTLGAHVENLTLTGTTKTGGTGNALANVLSGNAAGNRLDAGDGADSLRGGAGADTLLGRTGDDRLFGGAGNDSLDGGAGKDGFYFDAPLGRINVDRISDFSASDDTLFLDRDIFTAIAANGTLAPSAFRAGTAAADSTDRILYDAATGAIRYDPDGTGSAAAVLFAQLAPGTALTNADFVGYI